MFLFKARLAAQREYAEMLAKLGVTAEDVRAFGAKHPALASGLHRAPHAAAGTAADRLAEIAPFLGKSEAEIRALRLKAMAKNVVDAARALPGALATLRGRLRERAPVLFAQAREEWVDAKPVVVQAIRTKLSRTQGTRAVA
jgi:hypothetical protein